MTMVQGSKDGTPHLNSQLYNCVSLPLEFVANEVLPLIKGVVAHMLYEKGYSQSKIGHIFGVSQPAVNAYMKTPREDYFRRARGLGLSKEEVERAANTFILLLESLGPSEALRYLDGWLLSLLSSLKLCDAHRALAKVLPSDCDICLTLVSDKPLANLMTSIRLLSHGKAHRLVPNVRMNIVEARDGAVNTSDVAGFPGRITVIGDRLVHYSAPVYGASRFMGRMVIEAYRKCGFKAAANIAYNEAVEQALSRLGLEYTRVGPSNNEEETLLNILNALSEKCWEIVVDIGGKGIEPNTYVFGLDSIDVAKKIVAIAEHLQEPSS